jgi:hypothetical protein
MIKPPSTPTTDDAREAFTATAQRFALARATGLPTAQITVIQASGLTFHRSLLSQRQALAQELGLAVEPVEFVLRSDYWIARATECGLSLTQVWQILSAGEFTSTGAFTPEGGYLPPPATLADDVIALATRVGCLPDQVQLLLELA